MKITIEESHQPPLLPFHEVQDHLSPDDLPVLGGDVVLPLGLDDALAEVLHAVALPGRAADVDRVVQLPLGLGSAGLLKKTKFIY